MAYHPEVTKDLIFVGDKHGCLGIWDALAPPEANEDDQEEDNKDSNELEGRYWRLQPHWPKSSKSSISCIKFSPTDRRNVCLVIFNQSMINSFSISYFLNVGPYVGIRLHNPKHII